MTDPEQRQIEWATAEIEGGTLTVALSGAGGKAWSRRFDGVLELLGKSGDSWGEIKFTKKDAIRVDAVGDGAEADLRHFLESVVLEVNSHFEPDATASQPDRPEDDERDAAGARDEQMAATFRAFAGEEAEGAAEET
jgi:hypothetical protein